MPTYRIKKGKRVFKAERFGTLVELAGRGLLDGNDHVSVDGGAFRLASDIHELNDVIAEALAARLEAGEGEAPESAASGASANQGVLEAFLSEVSDAEVGSASGRIQIPVPLRPPTKSSPKRAAALPRKPAASVVGRLEREPEIEAIPELVHADLEILPAPGAAAVAPPSLPEPPPPPPSQAETPSAAGAGLGEDTDFRAAQARLGAMAAGAGAPSAPISFVDWMAKRGGPGESPTVLENFGVDDTLVALKTGTPVHKGFSLLRVILIVIFGAVLVGSWYMYVRTGATQEFPVESTLRPVVRQPAVRPDGTTPVVKVEPTPAVPGDVAARIRENRLRGRVGTDVVDFGNPDELESSLFIELQNLGCRPLSVDVTVLASRGASRRPTEIDLTIKQSPIADGSDQLAAIQDRLGTTWMLIGKYGDRGKVTPRKVVVQLEGQARWDRGGARLVALYKGTMTASDIFLNE